MNNNENEVGLTPRNMERAWTVLHGDAWDEAEARDGQEHAGLGIMPPERKDRMFGILSSVADGEEMKPWHGVWRYSHASGSADTAIVGLNLLLSWGWAIVVWVKHGGRSVAADPREAYVDGLNEGHERAVQELPDEMRNAREMLAGREEAAERALAAYMPMLRLRADVGNFTHQLLAIEASDELPDNVKRSLEQIHRVAADMRRRMDEEFAKSPYAVDAQAQADAAPPAAG